MSDPELDEYMEDYDPDSHDARADRADEENDWKGDGE